MYIHLNPYYKGTCKTVGSIKCVVYGIQGVLIGFPLIRRVSLTLIKRSPSQATNPILASLLSITFKLLRVMFISSEHIVNHRIQSVGLRVD
jgi:hypothetical protein